MSVRSLRDRLKDAKHPLPCFKVEGKIYVKWSEFEDWMNNYRASVDTVEGKVNRVMDRLNA